MSVIVVFLRPLGLRLENVSTGLSFAAIEAALALMLDDVQCLVSARAETSEKKRETVNSPAAKCPAGL